MKILFGSWLDSAEWTSAEASLNEIVCGPLGLLKLLETRLGFGVAAVSTAERINQYRKKVEASRSEWCRASFEKAPWQTAARLLSLRDALIEAGWDGNSGNASERFKFFETAERIGGDLAPGFGDRTLRLLPVILQSRFDDWTVTLKEPPEYLSACLQSVFDALKQSGAQLVLPSASENPVPPKACVQVVGDNENELAVHLCRYLKSGDNGKLAVICDGDSSALDYALLRYGFGAIGMQSPQRQTNMQVFPAFLELLWKPFDAHALGEFIALPEAPLTGGLKGKLFRVLGKEPGKGPAWDEMWQEAAGKDGWRAFFETQAFASEKEIAAEALLDACDFFVKACRACFMRDAILDEAFVPVIAQAETLKRIAKEHLMVSRELLNQILSSIVGNGTVNPRIRSEVNSFKVFAAPGEVSEDFETIIWWNFVEQRREVQTYWTQAELAHVPGLNSLNRRKCEAEAWKSVAAHARKRLILFSPKTLCGEVVCEHPFAPALWVKEESRISSASLMRAELWELADRSCRMIRTEASETDHTTGMHQLDIALAPDSDSTFSATQAESLLKCPFKWLLERKLGLRQNPILNIPTGERMLGTFAHKVIEILFREQSSWESDAAVVRAGELFEEWLPKIAAEFSSDKKKLEKRTTKSTFLNAVKVLMKALESHGLTDAKTEVKKEGVKFAGYDFKGYIDMLLKDKDGKDFIVDLKWSKAKRYKERLGDGKAFQLASYAALVRPEDFDVRCAYFSFPDKKFIEDEEQNKQWRQIWVQAETEMQNRLTELAEGKIALWRSEGGKKTEEAFSPCEFCNFSAFCGKGKESV